jgi:sirohydrochlorin cobaltochelatase
MAKSFEHPAALERLEFRIRSILPETYQDSYEEVRPVSMGSASLKYASDGQVAWDKMWDSFCDLAMAGGPPHKGSLLEPGTQSEIEAQPGPYQEVVRHICRGIEMVTGLFPESSSAPGWICVNCLNRATSDWLLRAITMENVSVRSEGLELYLPAGPSYRIEKEIKNVITAMAKTTHYWYGHTSQTKRGSIRDLLAAMEIESPLLQPASPFQPSKVSLQDTIRSEISQSVQQLTGLRTSNHCYSDWIGIEYPDDRTAIWMMRALIASNVLSRREGTVLFLPLDPIRDGSGKKAVQTVVRLHNFAAILGIFCFA